MVKIISMENLDFTTIRTPLMPHHLSLYSVCHVSQNERVENILSPSSQPCHQGASLLAGAWSSGALSSFMAAFRINDSSIRLATEEPAQTIPQDGKMVF